MKINIDNIEITSPQFCPKCNCNVNNENMYFNAEHQDEFLIPVSMRDAYYCFKCLCEFMLKHTNELYEFRLIKNKQ